VREREIGLCLAKADTLKEREIEEREITKRKRQGERETNYTKHIWPFHWLNPSVT
jgi:hypothetical protein